MKKESCVSCKHQDVCIMRSITIFELFIVTGREVEVPDAQKSLNIGAVVTTTFGRLRRSEMENVKAIEILKHSNELLREQINKLREIPGEVASSVVAYSTLKMCEEEYAAGECAISALQLPRRFFITVPGGKLKVQAKHDYERSTPGEDNPMDFPGVYIDLVRPEHDDVLLACVEHESCFDYLQACVYGDALRDDPTHVIKYDNLKME